MRNLPILAWSTAMALAGLDAPGRAADDAADPGHMARAEITLALGADGALAATGSLPQGLSSEELTAALPGIDISALDQEGTARPWEVERALDALSIVLPRFRTATVRLGKDRLAIEGALKSGLSTGGVEAALRSALGTGWRLDLRVTETAPLAELVLSQTGEGIGASGLLPAGLDASDALKLLGQSASDLGLAGGGDGSGGGGGGGGGGSGGAQIWSDALAALAETLDLFASATARVTAGEVAVRGVLRPGYPQGAVADRLGARLPAGWLAALDAEETRPNEGDRRVNLDTAAHESFRQGYWLPEVAFPVSTERCQAEAEAVLGGEGVPFVEGEAQIEEHGLPLLNRLAAIAVRCLNSSSLLLEIGGHTEAVGNDDENEALSQARADAVLQALLDRGVRAGALTAKGYGESRPVATNDTPDGRAQNRRIAFDWSDRAG